MVKKNKKVKFPSELRFDLVSRDWVVIATGRAKRPEAFRKEKRKINWKRIFFIFLGLAFFFVIYFSPDWPDAVDPMGKHFLLSKEGKGAIALFLMAGIWWIFEVVPIGVTSIAIGVFQALFAIRSAKDAFRDFMDPAVMFIFGSVVVGIAFTKTGLTKRLACNMLQVVGERTSMIVLGAPYCLI